VLIALPVLPLSTCAISPAGVGSLGVGLTGVVG
jgi:hypothetical protein